MAIIILTGQVAVFCLDHIMHGDGHFAAVDAVGAGRGHHRIQVGLHFHRRVLFTVLVAQAGRPDLPFDPFDPVAGVEREALEPLLDHLDRLVAIRQLDERKFAQRRVADRHRVDVKALCPGSGGSSVAVGRGACRYGLPACRGRRWVAATGAEQEQRDEQNRSSFHQ